MYHENKFLNNSTKIMKIEIFDARFSDYFINCLLLYFATTKTNYLTIIQIKFSFFSNKFQTSTYFGFRALRAWKIYTKSGKTNFFSSERINSCGSEDRQTYIHRLCMCCLVTGLNPSLLPWKHPVHNLVFTSDTCKNGNAEF